MFPQHIKYDHLNGGHLKGEGMPLGYVSALLNFFCLTPDLKGTSNVA